MSSSSSLLNTKIWLLKSSLMVSLQTWWKRTTLPMAVQLYNGPIVNTLDYYDNQHAEVIVPTCHCGPTTNSKQTMQTEKVSFRPRASRIILDWTNWVVHVHPLPVMSEIMYGPYGFFRLCQEPRVSQCLCLKHGNFIFLLGLSRVPLRSPQVLRSASCLFKLSALIAYFVGQTDPKYTSFCLSYVLQVLQVPNAPI